MPEPLKNLYTPELVSRLGDVIKKHHPSFKKSNFVHAVFDADWESRELKQRMRHITCTLHQHLPITYPEQIAVLKKAAPEFSGFLAMIFPDFAEVYGLNDLKTSIEALELFTQYSSSEFAVRPFIIRYETQMLKQHHRWAVHKNHHVRRLASEGIRPRLPWAIALPVFKKDPLPLISILELLQNDPSEYVRRSVANCLNDISKDHPDVVLDIIKKWKGKSTETDRIIRHASRGLLKKGHTEALSSFGLNHKVNAMVDSLQLSKQQLKIGGEFKFSFDITLKEKKSHDVRVEYKIYFMKSNGKPAPKIFQTGTYRMEPGEKRSLERKHKFADLTTRKHYPGKHRLVVVVNGKETAEAEFVLS